MYTRCPNCHTCFRITDRQLAMANGKVRCGKCTTVFNARQHAVDQAPAQPPATKSPVSRPGPGAQGTSREANQASPRATPVHHQETVVVPPSKPAGDSIKPGAIDNSFSSFEETIITSPAASDPGHFERTTISPDPISPHPRTSPSRETVPSREKKSAAEKLDIEEAESYHEIVPPAPQVSPGINNLQGYLPFDISNDDEIESIELRAADEFISLDDDLHPEADPFSDDDPFDENDFEVEKRILADLENTHAASEEPDKRDTREASLDDIFADIETSEASEDDIFGSDIEPQQETANDMPFRLRNNLGVIEKPPRSFAKTLLMLFTVLLLTLILTLQAAVFRSSDVLAMVPQSKPWLEKFCGHVPCLYSGPRDIEQIDMVSRDVRLHPEHKDILLISAAMKNRASFDQPYPDIELVLSDISGNIVAQRRFTPMEYMGKLNSPFLLMKSGQPVHLKLEVVDPGKDAVNFVFKFK